MKNNFYSIVSYFFVLIYFLISCREDLEFNLAKNKLQLSNDTIFFDTLLSNTKSQIYRLKLYNLENNDVEIPSVSLENQSNSFFKINVNGQEGPIIRNVPLKKSDSLYVFIEFFPQTNSNSIAYSDDILIKTSSGTQKVHLKSFVEKVINYNPPLNQTELSINSDTTWNNSSVYFINKSLKVRNNSILTIEAGTKVYFNKNSELVISEGSRLVVNGTVLDKVIFRTNVHTFPIEVFHDQWNTIKLEKGSFAEINNAIIKGGKNGLMINEANVKLNNIQIYNQTFNGIFASNSSIIAQNVVINNCGDTALKIERGGDYQFYHCTFNNYANFSNLDSFALTVSNKGIFNSVQDNKSLTRCIFGNCIFTGITTNSISIDKDFDSSLTFSYFFNNNLIKYQNNPDEIRNNTNFVLSMLNQDPTFIDLSLKTINLRLKSGSFARGKGIKEYSDLVPKNLDGLDRIHPSNLGAY